MSSRSDRRAAYARIAQQLPPYKRGLLEVARAYQREQRRLSPRARAGSIGGRITAALYPASRRPRDSSGRFAPAAAPAQTVPAGPGGIQPKGVRPGRGKALPVLNPPAAPPPARRRN